MKIISKNEAVLISSHFHNGILCPLYSFASTEIYLPEKHKLYIRMINSTKANTQGEILDLKNLKRFFQYKKKENEKNNSTKG